tara:strand:+ start:9880 stop:10296 length:417 start_codon:yes stop_codon:yes gene_type:complete
MNEWIYYGLVAALFISIKDILFTDLIKKYNYIDLMIITNIILFILTIGYLCYTKKKVKKIDKLDICKLILKIFIIYLIIDPCIYMSIKKTDNPGSAKAIVNLNTALTFILSIYLLNKKFTYKNLLFILIIVIFSLLLR